MKHNNKIPSDFCFDTEMNSGTKLNIFNKYVQHEEYDKAENCRLQLRQLLSVIKARQKVKDSANREHRFC